MTEVEDEGPSTIMGHVYDEKGNRLGCVKVTCDGMTITTLFDGSYRFENVSPSNYSVVVSLKGFKIQSRMIKVGKGDMLILDFTLQRDVGTGRIRGCVMDELTKEPITSGGTMILVMPVTNRYTEIDVRDGHYEFDGLPAGTYEVWTSISGYQNESITVEVEEDRVSEINFSCRRMDVVEPPWG